MNSDNTEEGTFMALIMHQAVSQALLGIQINLIFTSNLGSSPFYRRK